MWDQLSNLKNKYSETNKGLEISHQTLTTYPIIVTSHPNFIYHLSPYCPILASHITHPPILLSHINLPFYLHSILSRHTLQYIPNLPYQHSRDLRITSMFPSYPTILPSNIIFPALPCIIPSQPSYYGILHPQPTLLIINSHITVSSYPPIIPSQITSHLTLTSYHHILPYILTLPE